MVSGYGNRFCLSLGWSEYLFSLLILSIFHLPFGLLIVEKLLYSLKSYDLANLSMTRNYTFTFNLKESVNNMSGRN